MLVVPAHPVSDEEVIQVAHSKRVAVLAALVCLLIAAMAVPPLQAAVLKHKTTGETIRGTLTEQQINDQRVFKLEGGGNKFIKPDEWEIIEADDPADTSPTKVDEERTDTTETKERPTKAQKVRVYIIPISGPIMHSALIPALEKAIGEARSRQCELVVFQMDTPGGRLDLAMKIIDLVAGIDEWGKSVAWVSGNESKGALSAGAFISMSTHQIFMADDTTIGAATPYRQTILGNAEVTEKMKSAFAARFRALTQKRGYPDALASAMVDVDLGSVVQVFIDGQQKLVDEDEAKRLKDEHKGDDKFKRGDTICTKGKILTMTAPEAVKYGLAKAVAGNQDQLMGALGIENFQIYEAKWLPQQVAKEAEDLKKKFEKLRAFYNHNRMMANENEPRHGQYWIKEGTGNFDAVSQKNWHDRSEKCIGYVKNAIGAIKEIEKMAAQEGSDVQLSDEGLNDIKVYLGTWLTRLENEKNLRRPP